MEPTRTTERPVQQDGRRIRRVCLEHREAPELERPEAPEYRWRSCQQCGAQTLRGYLRCSQCGQVLPGGDDRPQLLGMSEFTEQVAEGQDMPAVSDYLHDNRYLLGPRVGTALRRRRRRLWRRLRREKQGKREAGSGEQATA